MNFLKFLLAFLVVHLPITSNCSSLVFPPGSQIWAAVVDNLPWKLGWLELEQILIFQKITFQHLRVSPTKFEPPWWIIHLESGCKASCVSFWKLEQISIFTKQAYKPWRYTSTKLWLHYISTIAIAKSKGNWRKNKMHIYKSAKKCNAGIYQVQYILLSIYFLKLCK